MGDNSSFEIRGKMAFMGHRRYLPENHIWHRSKLRDGELEHRPPQVAMNENDILEQLDSLNFSVMSKHPFLKIRKES